MIDEISIIIPTLNEAGYLPRLLDSIVKQSYTGKVQVIVVDGHSSDRTVELAHTFDGKLQDLAVVRAKRGTGRQRNAGADQAKYRYLLFLDADVVLPPHLIEQLTER